MFKYPIKLYNSVNSIRTTPLWLSQQIQTPIRTVHDEQILYNPRKPFETEVNDRQSQAKRSIFVETSMDTNSINELMLHCTRIGKVRNIYRNDIKSNAFFLIEYSSESAANEVIRTAFHSGNHMIDGKVRVRSRFLYFNAKNDTIIKRNPYSYKRDTSLTDHKSIVRAMRTEKTIDQQIMTLYKVNRLSDFSSRLRFLTALQMQDALSGIIYNAKILPFGSSINGFGTMQSDLDMVLVTGCNKSTKSQFSSIELGRPDDAPRAHIRNNLYVMSVIARNWLQGITEVTNVLNARVPIIKYVQELTQLDCDLSACNASGFQMSEIFYTFGELDERVRPLVFFVRTWAKEYDIIRPYPSQGLSNFMLTCMVIFFLQTRPTPILPPSDAFVKCKEPSAEPTLKYITDSTTVLNLKSENTSTLSELVVEFFEYYSKFNYNNDAISITNGAIRANIAADSIFIYNPLQSGVNVSRNITDFERNQFIEKCKITHRALTTDRIDAVEVLELWSKRETQETPKNLDTFVSNMVKSNRTPKDQKKDKSKQRSSLADGPTKFDVKSLMKTI